MVGKFLLACVWFLLSALVVTSGCDSVGDDLTDTRAPVADVAPADTQADAAPDMNGDVEHLPGDTSTDHPPDTVGDAEDAPVRYLYDPVGGRGLTTFPDDYYTEVDASTVTGLRVALSPALAPWWDDLDTLSRAFYESLNELDGWGTNAAVVLHFDGAVGDLPEGERATLQSEAVMMIELGPEGPRRVPFVVELTPDHSVLLWPMFPLRPSTRHGVVVTKALTAADMTPLASAPALEELLAGESDDERLAALAPRYAELLEAAAVNADDVVAAVVFTTQSVVEESVAIAADIATREVVWAAPPACEPEGEIRRCEGTATFHSYRDEQLVLAGTTPARTYEIGVSIWLPDPATPDLPDRPWPTLIYGHGLVHERGQARSDARRLVPRGTVIAAIDAPGHGKHPTAPEDESLAMFAFFAADLEANPLSMDPVIIRDNFREAAYDKLQLLRLLETHRDIDGDGVEEVDVERFGYIGESFGGIMSIEPAALQDRFDVMGLQLGGARVATMLKEARRFAIFVPMITPRGVSRHVVTRLFPVLQTAVERGDPANYAAHVLGERLPGAGSRKPHVLLQLVIDDDTIPEVANRALTRALGLPHVEPRVEAYDGVPVGDAPPVALNILDGERTAGFFQYDRITRREGEAPEVASHDFTPSSLEGRLQFMHFMLGWLDPDESAEIIDPYHELSTPPLQ